MSIRLLQFLEAKGDVFDMSDTGKGYKYWS